MKTETEVSTKVTKDAEAPIKTALTIDWEGLTEDEMRAMAQAALIVKWQGQSRTNGIPVDATIKATDYRVGTRAPKKVLTLQEQLDALTPEQRKELLEKMLAQG